ncbi:MAG TPA: antibiotic biosynthesis monooxygenase [Candidatus Avipropionibacterium avicola]|uniref:Antibiotic biosynthesis monooxygenase n=1 Tax=Candidatus Avipropionibacterium avicola TaxID=2840701 RepID=A0A9D1KN81_9ACTN|nr:antibiotic biosynthesis monooxygenase [Candidatus Avipropionibacterium avicola]
MIVLTRFRVAETASADFAERANAAVALLESKPGLLSLDFGRNLDEPELWTLTTRWADVGSYRRALSGMDSKMVLVPLLSEAIDEPTAYDDADLVGENVPRGWH